MKKSLMFIVTFYMLACKPSKLYYHGRVVDMYSKPIKDVYVFEEGTSNYTTTDTNGYFKLPRYKKVNNSLRFAKKFYHPQTYPGINRQKEWNFSNSDTTVILLYPIIR